MSRYIDADKLYKDMQWNIQHDMYDKPFDYLAEIDCQPAADVRENVRGEWIEVLRDTYGGGHFPYSKCSVCQSEQIIDSNFCPNCGAEMRGGNDD